MGGTQTVCALGQFTGRGAGTDAERRTARWLAQQLEHRGREVAVETFWCRPNWALAQAWHVALALAGSLVSVASPRAGSAMLLGALVFVLADALASTSPGRWLTPEQASQNVVGIARQHLPPEDLAHRLHERRLNLIITANYDAGRAGLAYREPLRSAAASLHRLAGGMAPGWLGWLTVAITSLLATSVLRLDGHDGLGVGLAQLPATVGLLLALALLLECAAAEWSPSAGDNATGVEVALSLEGALATSPPRHLDLEIVLTGASDAEGLGLRDYLRTRRTSRRPENSVVLGISACADGTVCWWRSDGRLLPLSYGRRLVALAKQIALEQPHLHARPYRGRGATPALPARRRGIPAIAIGCLDERGLAPRSHQPGDTPDALEGRCRDQALQFGLMLADAIDAALDESPPRGD